MARVKCRPTRTGKKPGPENRSGESSSAVNAQAPSKEVLATSQFSSQTLGGGCHLFCYRRPVSAGAASSESAGPLS